MAFSPDKRQMILRQLYRYLTRTKLDTAEIARRLNVSRTTVQRYSKEMVEKSLLVMSSGEQKFKPLYRGFQENLTLTGLDEAEVYHDFVAPKIVRFSPNIRAIIEYGFTEMLNNAIDHSESKTANIYIMEDFISLRLAIRDYGVGIFQKVQQSLGLSSQNYSILELDKGKCTTDPDRHSGEGIFFASKMFDRFSIAAGGLVYTSRSRFRKALLLEGLSSLFEPDEPKGTEVIMEIDKDSDVTIEAVFNRFTDDAYSFNKTIISCLHLLEPKANDKTLTSRTQARRLLAHLERFTAVSLDFSGIERIGQGFADEIFRVYRKKFPQVAVYYLGANENVEKMIRHALSGSD